MAGKQKPQARSRSAPVMTLLSAGAWLKRQINWRHADTPGLMHRPGAVVEAIDCDTANDELWVTFSSDGQPEPFDRIIANVGYRGDHSLHAELRVLLCEQTECPWGMRQSVNATANATTRRADRLITTEPHFYILVPRATVASRAT